MRGKTENTLSILDSSVLGYSSPITIEGDWPEPIAPTRVWGNCIATVKGAGYDVPRTLDGTAGSIPVVGKEIAEGEVKVAITREGPVGHALVVQKIDGVLVSVVEGNHSIGVGRIVDPSVLKGFTE